MSKTVYTLFETSREHGEDVECALNCRDILEKKNHLVLSFLHRLSIAEDVMLDFCLDNILFHQNEKHLTEEQLIMYYVMYYLSCKAYTVPEVSKDIPKFGYRNDDPLFKEMGKLYCSDTATYREKLKKECAHHKKFMEAVRLIDDLDVIFQKKKKY